MKIFDFFKKTVSNKKDELSFDEVNELSLFNLDIHSESFLQKAIELKDVNKKFQKGFNLLHFACEYGSIELAKKMIERKISIEDKNIYGNTPLWIAVFNSKGNYEFVDLLLLNNANPNCLNKANNTPFKFAQTIGDDILIKKLEKATTNR